MDVFGSSALLGFKMIGRDVGSILVSIQLMQQSRPLYLYPLAFRCVFGLQPLLPISS